MGRSRGHEAHRDNVLKSMNFLPGTNLELLIQRLESRMSCEMARLMEVACFGASFSDT